MRLGRRVWGFVLFTLAAWAVVPRCAAQVPVDLQLVLAIDGSGSIDDAEMALQTGGIAAAFRDPEVQAAIAAGPLQRIAVTAIIWAEANLPKDALPWHLVQDAEFGRVLRRCRRRLQPPGGDRRHRDRQGHRIRRAPVRFERLRQRAPGGRRLGRRRRDRVPRLQRPRGPGPSGRPGARRHRQWSWRFLSDEPEPRRLLPPRRDHRAPAPSSWQPARSRTLPGRFARSCCARSKTAR